MRTIIDLRWISGGAVVAMALVICTSAFAGANNNAVTSSSLNVTHKSTGKHCYVKLSSSGIPEPCDRLGRVPTTSGPLTILGTFPTERIQR